MRTLRWLLFASFLGSMLVACGGTRRDPNTPHDPNGSDDPASRRSIE